MRALRHAPASGLAYGETAPLSKACRRTVLWLLALFAATAGAAESTPPSTPYREPFAESFPNRREQHLQIKAYADKLLSAQAEKALRAVEPDFSSVAAYERSLPPFREKLSAFYGTPPPGAKAGRVTKFLPIGDDADCTIFRVWVEVVDGVEAYGIYMVPKKLKGKAPLIIAQHGGGGNPEAICDLDTRVNYRAAPPRVRMRACSPRDRPAPSRRAAPSPPAR